MDLQKHEKLILQKAETLARKLMDKHELENWLFKFDNAKNSFGSCNSHKKLITLSRQNVIYKDRGRIKDMILHEIAHALNRKKYSYQVQSHGHEWKQIAKSIGCYDELLDW